MPLMMATTPHVETASVRETGAIQHGQQKLTTLDRRVHNIGWTKQVFRGLGKSIPGRGHGARLADIR